MPLKRVASLRFHEYHPGWSAEGSYWKTLSLLTKESEAARPQTWRSACIFLISAIARAGERPLGHTFEQFMIVWQR